MFFDVTAGGTISTLFSFDGFDDGAHPETPLVQGADGVLYGTSSTGGQFGGGTVFRLDVAMQPRLLAPTQTNGSFAFTMETVAGRVCQVEYNTDLSGTNWITVNNFTASGGPLTITNGTGTDPKRFYRVLVVP